MLLLFAHSPYVRSPLVTLCLHCETSTFDWREGKLFSSVHEHVSLVSTVPVLPHDRQEGRVLRVVPLLPLLLRLHDLLVDVDETVVDDLEGRHEGEAHAEAQEAAGVGHEPDERDLLVSFHPRDHGVLDVHVDQGHVALGVVEQVPADEVVEGDAVLHGVQEEGVVVQGVPEASRADPVLGPGQVGQVAADAGVVVGEGRRLPAPARLDELADGEAELDATVEGLGVGEGRAGLGDEVDLVLAGGEAGVAGLGGRVAVANLANSGEK